MTIRINVIDSDVRRRARISHELNARNAHVEIYEGVAELSLGGKANGLIFLCDEPAGGLAQTIDRLRKSARAIMPVVGYAQDPQPEHVVSAMRAGALDYLRWPFDERLLDRVFERVSNGDDRFVRQELLRSRARARVHDLTGRERDVLTHLVNGLSNKAIGRALGISPRTVEIHRANMMTKLGANSSPDAVRIGIYAGLDKLADTVELLAVA
jgi:FixJ family two-component response regulator